LLGAEISDDSVIHSKRISCWYQIQSIVLNGKDSFYLCTVPFEIYVVHAPTNALFINLVISFKFTLKYTEISLYCCRMIQQDVQNQATETKLYQHQNQWKKTTRLVEHDQRN